MMSSGKPFVRGLVTEQVRKFVAKAIESGETISTAEVIKKVRALYPQAGISKGDLTNEVMMAASAAGVAVEIGRAKVPEKKQSRGMRSGAC
jgi:hypothetical protein